MPDEDLHQSRPRKTKEQIRVFVRRHRQSKRSKTRKNFSRTRSKETLRPKELAELVTLIQRELNQKRTKASRHDRQHIVVVNYKPVFVNQRAREKKTKEKFTRLSNEHVDDDGEMSSATHYSRPRTFTSTSSDGSPVRSTAVNQNSLAIDVPDVEDPLEFIEMMYQQLFTEDGRLRSGTAPTALANCVKQIVTKSRQNSVSSSVSSLNVNQPRLSQVNPSQRTLSTPSPRLVLNDQENVFSEEEEDDGEEEEEPNTVVQNHYHHATGLTKSTDVPRR